MKVWQLKKEGLLLEVWDVAKNGEMERVTRLELKQTVTKDEAADIVQTMVDILEPQST